MPGNIPCDVLLASARPPVASRTTSRLPVSLGSSRPLSINQSEYVK